VVRAAERFVAGEASAVVHWIARGVPTPTHTPPRLSERGLHHRPTLVQNVETLAHLALIARFGSRWFREVGTAAEPGSTLVTLLGAIARPGVYEVPIGLSVREVLGRGGGPVGAPRAVLLGGYFGGFADLGSVLELPFSRAGLAPLGAAPGAGLLAVLPEDACGLVETARVARYLARESAGQCGPCRFGLPAIADEVERLAFEGSFRAARLSELFVAVEHRGACAHPDGAVRLVRSALAVFADEIDLHASGRCVAPRPTDVLPTPDS
jgi:NADH:ubiquinone oxidoreductase subunit F (NADH-binding)